MSDLKIAIVGAGFAARVIHLPGYAGAGQPVAAICDLDEKIARTQAEQHNIPQVYTDWREMLEQERPDVVGVCLPNVLHHAGSMRALGAGCVCARGRRSGHVFAGILAAVCSRVVGLVFLFRAGGFLPDLDPYFRWIGGPG